MVPLKYLTRRNTMITEHKATLTIRGEAPLPISVLAPTQGKACLDIRTLGGRSGYFAYDSGFESTAGCKSRITCIDGEKGEVLHYGYPIEQLAEQCDFLEVAYLLKNGELPNAMLIKTVERIPNCWPVTDGHSRLR